MSESPHLTLSTVVLDCLDAQALADFYRRLLSWDVKVSEPGWVLLGPPNGGTGMSFQSETWYQRPVWPEQPGEPHKMLHLDIQVDNMQTAVAHALALGASDAYGQQPRFGSTSSTTPAGARRDE